ncbi:MAG TPA: hypothetical protein VFK94_04045 [Patescibacteria group bacterium]|nr:hypothetical protein [Patescibacteria group bacterium]
MIAGNKFSPPRTRKERRKRQQLRTLFYRARSCEGKIAFDSLDEAARFVAKSLHKVPWVTEYGLRKKDPIVWGLNGYRCGFGSHFHLGHIRRDRSHLATRFEQFHEMVLEKIAEEVWPYVKKELEKAAASLKSELTGQVI